MNVIASEAKQSMHPWKGKLDCFVATAPRNDETWMHWISSLGRFEMLRRLVSAILMSMTLASASFAADGKSHHLALHIDQNDPVVMNQTLNNATNVIEYFRGKNEDVDVDIVAYGPGLHMLRADTSPVQDRIRRLKDMVFPGKIQFSACNVTKQGMEKTEGHAISILPDATVVPSGVVHLMELQEQGWSYVRP
jgi:intracellular sulfur oxidation DsrE/DsrF family protein